MFYMAKFAIYSTPLYMCMLWVENAEVGGAPVLDGSYCVSCGKARCPLSVEHVSDITIRDGMTLF